MPSVSLGGKVWGIGNITALLVPATFSSRVLETCNFGSRIFFCKTWGVSSAWNAFGNHQCFCSLLYFLCKYFPINKCTFQTKGICWNPKEGLLEAMREQRNILDEQHMSFQRAPLLTGGDVLARPIWHAAVTLEDFTLYLSSGPNSTEQDIQVYSWPWPHH